MSMLRTYTLGFVLSILLTLAAFVIVGDHLRTGHAIPPHYVVVPILVGLALVQLFVQLTFFLHLGEERKPRWSLGMLALALMVVCILVGGTLWIMRTITHQQMQEVPDMFEEENILPSTLHG